MFLYLLTFCTLGYGTNIDNYVSQMELVQLLSPCLLSFHVIVCLTRTNTFFDQVNVPDLNLRSQNTLVAYILWELHAKSWFCDLPKPVNVFHRDPL